jgi:hypothetical protein
MKVIRRTRASEAAGYDGTRDTVTLGHFIHWVRMGKEMAVRWIRPEFRGMQTESLCYAANTKASDGASACQRLFETAAQLLSANTVSRLGPRSSHAVSP